MLEGSSFRLRLARLIGRVAIVLAIAGPIMSAIGYDAVGQAMVYPAVKTLAVLALVLVLQRFVNDLYELITGRSAQAADSLAPVLAGLVLLLLALPALALIWGARVADLTELWARFREGFTFGDTRISPMDGSRRVASTIRYASAPCCTRPRTNSPHAARCSNSKRQQGHFARATASSTSSTPLPCNSSTRTFNFLARSCL